MKTICAWCETDIGIKPSIVGSNGGVSHGICADCLSTAIESLARQEDSWQAFGGGSGACHSPVDKPFVGCLR